MAQRIRSILVDNTLGKIFTGANTVSNASAANLIAGTQKLVKTFASGVAVNTKVANNLTAGSGLLIGNNGVLVSVTLMAVTAPLGSNISVNLKKGSAYASSSIVGTYTLSPGSNLTYYTTAISFLATDNFFIDITQVGSVKSGVGFSIQLGYYSGY